MNRMLAVWSLTLAQQVALLFTILAMSGAIYAILTRDSSDYTSWLIALVIALGILFGVASYIYLGA